MSELKQCPFCGSDARELEWPEGGEMDRYACADRNHVDCALFDVEFTLDEWERRPPNSAPGSTLKVMRGPGGGLYLSGVEDLREGDVFRREVRGCQVADR